MLTVTRQTASMHTRDGVRLDADVYRPTGAGPWPVLLMRQPYGRAIASTVVYAHPTWYAAHGYLVVIQDVRGRGTSAGEFDLFAHEIADGADTVNWAAQLPDSTGAVGMYGFSYQGMTQLYAAVERPPALKTLCPAMIGYDLYGDWAYENGAFCLQGNLAWAIQLAAETARRQGDADAHRQLVAAAQHLPLAGAVPGNPDLLRHLAPESFYHDWLAHPHPDAYWEALSPRSHLAAVDLPMLHIGGWFDPFLRGTVNLYEAMAHRCTQPQHLIIGPWAHLPWGRQVSGVDFGAAAVSDCDRRQLHWFDYWLKGIDHGLATALPVRLFELGPNRWREATHWPPPGHPTAFYLSWDGLASVQGGHLTPTPPDDTPIPDVLVHDPWRPVPFVAGPGDRAALDDRPDVLTYTTAPLRTPLTLSGTAIAEIYCQADTPSFDLGAVLSTVSPTGTVQQLTQGYQHVPPGTDTQPLRLPLAPTCATLPPGQSLRLSLSAAAYPAYPVNPGDGTPPAIAPRLTQRLITLTVTPGSSNPSRLLIPPV